MWHGMFLFLLGLITGLVEQRFTNIRMGLSAHLEGVMNGMLTTLLGAAFGTAAASPVTAAGHSGKPWQETLVTAGFLSASISIVAATVLIL
jgi:hydroxylaminobenzene mutase